MEDEYGLCLLDGKDIFKIVNENRDKIDEYFWTYYKNVTAEKQESYVRDICVFLKPFGEILSIGCGHGLIEMYLCDMCREVKNIKGIDLIEFKIRSMNEILDLLGLENLIGIHADGLNIDFPDESFDTVIIIESLSHADKQYQLLKEATRVLKKKGAIFVLDFNNGANPRIWLRSWKQRHYEDIIENIVNPYFVRNRLSKMGFKDFVIEPYRNGPSLDNLIRMLSSKGLKFPSTLRIFVSTGFMLKAVKH